MLEYFETDDEIYIVMEYLDRGDLLQYLKNYETPMAEKDAKQMMRQILYGLAHIHC
jgi:serine/threonine protein kinase